MSFNWMGLIRIVNQRTTSCAGSDGTAGFFVQYVLYPVIGYSSYGTMSKTKLEMSTFSVQQIM